MRGKGRRFFFSKRFQLAALIVMVPKGIEASHTPQATSVARRFWTFCTDAPAARLWETPRWGVSLEFLHFWEWRDGLRAVSTFGTASSVLLASPSYSRVRHAAVCR